MKKLIIIVLLIMLATGCLPRSAKEKETSEPSPSPSKTSEKERTEDKDGRDDKGQGKSTKFLIYFFNADKLESVESSAPRTKAVAKAALTGLLNFSDNINKEKGLPENAMTMVSSGSKLMSLSLKDEQAEVVMSKDFFSPFSLAPAGEINFSQALAQVVYTLTQFPTVKKVRIEADKDGADDLPESSRGLLDKSLSRLDFAEYAPASTKSEKGNIIVVTPTADLEIGSPFELTGKARAFEGNLQVRLLGEGGVTLLKTFVSATAGAPEWGTFSQGLSFTAAESQEGKLEVYIESAETGQPEETVSIPVTIASTKAI